MEGFFRALARRRPPGPEAEGEPDPTAEGASPLDLLAKGLAQGVSRREALRRCGVGIASTLLASLGMKEAAAQLILGDAESRCDCCRFCNALPAGPVRTACLQEARGGFGLCFQCGGSLRRLCVGAGGFFCCPEGQRCQDGTCVPDPCPPNSFRCGDVCCPNDQFCFAGSCHPCQRGQYQCGSTCCEADRVCCNGACCPGGWICSPDGVCEPPPCPGGLVLCPSGCVDIGSDVNNCGACGNVCEVPVLTDHSVFDPVGPILMCVDGQCVPNCCPGDTATAFSNELFGVIFQDGVNPICDFFGLPTPCFLCIHGLVVLDPPGDSEALPCVYAPGSTTCPAGPPECVSLSDILEYTVV